MSLVYAPIFLLLPCAASFFIGLWDKKNLKRSLILLAAAAVAVNLLTVIAGRFLGSGWTNYEYALACSLVSPIVLLIFISIFFKRKNTYMECLKALCWGCVAVAVYSALTLGQAVINSDTATASLLSKSQIEHRSFFPASWNYANGEIWTIGLNTCTLPFVVLLKNQSLARALGSALCLLATAAGIIFLCRKVFKDNSWTLAIPLFMVFIAGIGSREQILYEAGYVSSMLWMVIGVGLVFLAIQKKNIIIALCYMALSLVLNIGGARFAAEQALPLFLAFVFAIYLEIKNKNKVEWKKQTKRLAYVAVLLFLPVLGGLYLRKILSGYLNLNNNVLNSMVLVGSLNAFADNLVDSIIQLFECFGYFGGGSVMSLSGMVSVISIAVCLMICVIVPVLQGLKLRQESKAIQFFYYFGIAHNIILLVSKAAFGLMMTPRYMLTSAYVFILISSRYIFVYWIGQRNFMRWFWTGAFGVAAAMECLLLVSNGMGWFCARAGQKAIAQSLVDHGLNKGYASYWNAYKYEIYSDFDLRFGGIIIGNNAVSRFSWLVDGDAFAPQQGQSFLMLDGSENAMLAPGIPAMFGAPTETFDLSGYSVYVFDHDIAADFDRGLNDGVLRPYELSANDRVHINGDSFVLNDGGVVYGPYAALNAGEYLIEFYGDNLSRVDYDIHSETEQGAIEYTKDPSLDDRLTVHLVLKEDVADIEFRMFNHSEDDVFLRTIRIDGE